MTSPPSSAESRHPKRALFMATVHTTVEAFLLPLAAHLRNRGWSVDAMASGIASSPACRQAFDRTLEVSWTRNPVDLRKVLQARNAIRTAVRVRHYDVVHVHTPVAAFIGRQALRTLRRDHRFVVIYTAHGFHFHPGGSPIGNTFYLALEKLAGKWTDHLVVLNSDDEAAALRFRIVPPHRLHRMPSALGVDLSPNGLKPELDREVAEAREMIGLKPADKLLVMVAEFIPRKRHRDALQAFAKLDRHDAHLAFVGDGPLRRKTERLAWRLGIKDRVHFLGFRTDVPILMRAAVASLLPSAREGLPQSILESIQLGTPAIGTAIRGTRELLEDGAGILVSVGDIDGLCSAMSRVIDDPEHAMTLSLAGLKRAAQYDATRILALHERLYESCLANR